MKYTEFVPNTKWNEYRRVFLKEFHILFFIAIDVGLASVKNKKMF